MAGLNWLLRGRLFLAFTHPGGRARFRQVASLSDDESIVLAGFDQTPCKTGSGRRSKSKLNEIIPRSKVQDIYHILFVFGRVEAKGIAGFRQAPGRFAGLVFVVVVCSVAFAARKGQAQCEAGQGEFGECRRGPANCLFHSV